MAFNGYDMAAGVGGASPATEWKRWRQKFEIYLTESRQLEADDDEICYYIQLGRKDWRSFTFTKDEKKSRYSAVLTKFQSHYVPKLNVTYERHKFFRDPSTR